MCQLSMFRHKHQHNHADLNNNYHQSHYYSEQNRLVLMHCRMKIENYHLLNHHYQNLYNMLKFELNHRILLHSLLYFPNSHNHFLECLGLHIYHTHLNCYQNNRNRPQVCLSRYRIRIHQEQHLRHKHPNNLQLHLHHKLHYNLQCNHYSGRHRS